MSDKQPQPTSKIKKLPLWFWLVFWVSGIGMTAVLSIITTAVMTSGCYTCLSDELVYAFTERDLLVITIYYLFHFSAFFSLLSSSYVLWNILRKKISRSYVVIISAVLFFIPALLIVYSFMMSLMFSLYRHVLSWINKSPLPIFSQAKKFAGI